MELWRLSDEELVERVESLSEAGPDSEALWETLAEVFRRMREEAMPGKRAYVEAVIDRLTWTFSQRDDDDGQDPPGAGGVREPRRPAPAADGAAVAAALPHRYGEAA